MDKNTTPEDKSKGIVNIHGKDYMTVSRRVELAHKDELLEVATEVLSHSPVVIKALVVTKKGRYTGISSVNLESTKMIERQNPYEVAETSAVGRALGFAGYGLIDSIASAEEMVKAGKNMLNDDSQWTKSAGYDEQEKKYVCAQCGQPGIYKEGISKAGKPYKAVFCSTEDKSHTTWL